MPPTVTGPGVGCGAEKSSADRFAAPRTGGGRKATYLATVRPRAVKITTVSWRHHSDRRVESRKKSSSNVPRSKSRPNCGELGGDRGERIVESSAGRVKHRAIRKLAEEGRDDEGLKRHKKVLSAHAKCKSNSVKSM